jgi:hypothetical protein
VTLVAQLDPVLKICLLSHRDLPTGLLILSLAGSAMVYACTLSYPFNNDNALYAYMSALLLEGRMPYLGSWDQNFPGILLVHAPQILLLGRSQIAFHVWDIFLQLVGSYFLFRLGLRWGGKTAAFLAPVIAAFYYVQQGLWMAGERDTYISILVLLALFEVTDRYRLERRDILVGVVLGLAILFRPTFAALVPVFLLYQYLDRKQGGSLLRTSAGGAIPLASLLLVYLAAGGLKDLYEATIRFNTSVYIGQGSVFSFWEPIRFYWLVLPFAALGVWQLYRKDRAVSLLIVLTLASAIASIILLYRHSVYHYHPAMTIFLLMGSIGIGVVIDRLTHRASSRRNMLACRAIAVMIVLCFFGVQTLRGNTIKTVLADLLTGKIGSLEEAYSYYEGSPDFGVGIQRSVGEYLDSHTSDAEPVQMFGPYSFPQYYSRISTASRFQTLHALTMRREGDPLTSMQKTWREEYLRDLQATRPKYFVVCDAPEAFRQYYAGRLGHEILKEDMTEVGEWLKEHYRADTMIGAFTIYSRND